MDACQSACSSANYCPSPSGALRSTRFRTPSPPGPVRDALSPRHLHTGPQADSRLLCSPVSLGEPLVARVDLKHDRHRDALLVRSAFAEAPGPNEEAVATWPDRNTDLHELASELATMASWLGASGVAVDKNAPGDLAGELNAQIVALKGEI